MKIEEKIKRYLDNAEYERTHGNLQGCLDFKQLAEWLKELKQLREQTRWIPVSERLPEKNMECLVAVGDFNLTQTAMYSNLMGIKNHRIFYQGNFGDDNFEDITKYVKAWMPLPKPYKPQERSDKE